MEFVNVIDLEPRPSLSYDIYDMITATRLFRNGERLTRAQIALLKSKGINRVAVLHDEDQVEQFERSIKFNEIDLEEIAPGTRLSFDLHTINGQFLLAKGTILKHAILEKLKAHNIKRVLIKREPDRHHLKILKEIIAQIRDTRGQDETQIATPSITFSANDVFSDPSAINAYAIKKMAEGMERLSAMTVAPDPANSLLRFMRVVDAMEEREEKTKEDYRDLYLALVSQTSEMFQGMLHSEAIKGEAVGSMAEQVVSALVNDRELLLNTIFLPISNVDYLARHAVNVTLIALNIAAANGYSKKQVAEIGYGALLADSGMLKIPDAIRFKEGKLSNQEQLEIMRHTIYGIELLQHIRMLPKTTALVAYQAHERLDGSGYPHSKRQHGIHDFAKIIAIADVYNAQISHRPFRLDSRLPYRAMEEVLKMAASKKLDNRFTRSLLSVVSLFPVGSWVKLNSGESAKVLQAHRTEYTKPTVVVLYDENGLPCSPKRINLAETDGIEVDSAIEMSHEDPMAGF